MRDSHQSRCYRGMKLASWLTENSYWEDTLTQSQVLRLLNRVLNHPEVYGRWNLTEVELEFPKTGTTAWAMKLGRGRARICLPPGTRNPLIVLHEVAHLLPVRKREPMHGPGFMAVHLMLVDLFVSSERARVLASCYHALGAPVDSSLIPASEYVSSYIPIVGGTNLLQTSAHLGAMLASGILTDEEQAAVKRMIRKLRSKAAREPQSPVKPIPSTITIKTSSLLSAVSDKEIAKVVFDELRAELMPKRMVPPRKKPSELEAKRKADARQKMVKESYGAA